MALSWMLKKEERGCPCFGGVLADDQGLGKTITTLALILSNKRRDISTKVMPCGGTLIVCPTSLLNQWSEEIKTKISSQARLSVLLYHGAKRPASADDLASHDVVLTSYGIVAASGPIAKVEWFRIVLDEAQMIKTHKSLVSVACSQLHGHHRWCLSGTPIQNHIDDLFSYFRFLKCKPYCFYNSFLKELKEPIIQNKGEGYKKLKLILKTLILRRTKATLLDGKPIISLPLKTVELLQIEFTKEEAEFYKQLEKETHKEYTEARKRNSSEALSKVTRLRQACDHPLLVPGSSWESPYSSKTDAVLDIIRKVKGVGQKVIVFSQWTKMLDLLQPRLELSSMKFRRFDGKMSIEARDQAIKDFKSLPEVTVIIMSLKAACVGLNLTEANHVVLVEPWWNPATEDQAIDRVHRIGQINPVKVMRIVIKNSIEDRLLSLQEKKMAIVSCAFGNANQSQMSFSEEEIESLLMHVTEA